jgi:drug/metabolite transporter (DMT)-like permease
MVSLSKIPAWVYKILIILATVIWGFSFVVMKDTVEVLPPAWLLGFRFTTAGIILTAILWKRVRRAFSLKVLGAGALLGVFDFSAFWTQTVGLEYTTPGINAFLTATYCVIVPFLWWIIARRRPTIFNIGAAALAVAGIWLVSVSTGGETLTLGFGEGMTLACALLFAVHIVFTSKFSQVHDVLVLTAIQFVTEGVLGLLVGAGFETLPALSQITPSIVGGMAFLIIFASIVAFGIQNVSLAYVPPAQASLFLSLESVFGVVFSVLLYGEQLTLRLVAGFVLIFVAIVISETFPLKKEQ